MRPSDSHRLPGPDRALRVLLLSGSQRRQYNCPGVDAKSRALVLRMADRLPQYWEIDVEDLSNVYGRPKIQSCNGCASTSMALCVWPCNCYEKNNADEPDLVWNLDLYARLDLADAWGIVGPINWYGPSSNLKLLFDRLVCANGGNPDERRIRHKDPELAMALERSPEWEELSQNHLEGRTAAFFCYGDEGADEIGGDGRPKKLRIPAWFDPGAEPFAEERDAYAPLVWQCRYSGVEVPDSLWSYATTGARVPYSLNQAEHLTNDAGFLAAFDAWTDRFASHVGAKGLVPPGKYRAAGYEPPGHHWADLRLKWRTLRLSAGRPPAGSSPAAQQALGLNRDATFRPAASEVSRNGRG